MTQPALYQIFYVSRSLATPQQVEDILSVARTLNAQRELTGALLYTGGHFAQVIEGPAPALAETMVAITVDVRHAGMRKLKQGPIDQRRYGRWQMSYAVAPGADDLLGDLLSASAVSEQRAQRVLDLMFQD